MLQTYSALRPTIQSGDVIAFRRSGPTTGTEVTLYSHVALALAQSGRLFLIEANRHEGAHISVASQRLAPRCDLLRLKVNWTTSVEQWAFAPAGKGLTFLENLLKTLGLTISPGANISSLFVAAILKRAGVHLSEQGYTPQALIDDLISLGAQLQRLDCQAVGNPGLVRIQILNSQGKPMTTVSIPRNETDTFPLSFLDSSGNPVAVPAEVQPLSSDTTIATVAIVPNNGVDELVVTPVANGSAVITVTSGTISATLDVTIEDPTLASIVIGEGTLSPIAPVAPAAPVEPVAGQ